MNQRAWLTAGAAQGGAGCGAVLSEEIGLKVLV